VQSCPCSFCLVLAIGFALVTQNILFLKQTTFRRHSTPDYFQQILRLNRKLYYINDLELPCPHPPVPPTMGKKFTEDDLHWGSCNPFSSFYTAYTQHSDAILEDIITRGYDVISTSARTVTTGDGRTVPTLVVGLRTRSARALMAGCQRWARMSSMWLGGSGIRVKGVEILSHKTGVLR
jgi:hypothetical protein